MQAVPAFQPRPEEAIPMIRRSRGGCVVVAIVAILLVSIVKNEWQFYSLYTTPTPPKGQQLVWSTKISFVDYETAKAQADALQERYQREFAEKARAAEHRARAWTWVKWFVGLSLLTLVLFTLIKLRRRHRPAPKPTPTPALSDEVVVRVKRLQELRLRLTEFDASRDACEKAFVNADQAEEARKQAEEAARQAGETAKEAKRQLEHQLEMAEEGICLVQAELSPPALDQPPPAGLTSRQATGHKPGEMKLNLLPPMSWWEKFRRRHRKSNQAR
jgi:hypothetical protein